MNLIKINDFNELSLEVSTYASTGKDQSREVSI